MKREEKRRQESQLIEGTDRIEKFEVLVGGLLRADMEDGISRVSEAENVGSSTHQGTKDLNR